MIFVIHNGDIVATLLPTITFGPFFPRKESNWHWTAHVCWRDIKGPAYAQCTSTLTSHMDEFRILYPGCIFQYVA